MLATVHVLRPETAPSPQPQTAIAYPNRSSILGPEVSLSIDYVSGVVDTTPGVEDPDGGAPQVFARGPDVVLDLGECTPDRTLLTLDPDAALEWAAALTTAAHAARKATP